MINITHISVYNVENALRGMRNAFNSHASSDSYSDGDAYIIGEKDMALALKLVTGGDDHGKFLRQFMLSMDITAPLYYWKEFDTYKVGTVANSTSTMHKLGSRDLTPDDFSIDVVDEAFTQYLDMYNGILHEWRADKSESKFRRMIQMLLDSFNQTRTVSLNYTVARHMYHARKSHKLREWREFCATLETLPYATLITAPYRRTME